MQPSVTTLSPSLQHLSPRRKLDIGKGLKPENLDHDLHSCKIQGCADPRLRLGADLYKIYMDVTSNHMKKLGFLLKDQW